MLSASKAGMSAVYTYDPLGRRVAKSVNGAATATLFDGDSEIGDIEGGVYVRRYVPGAGIDAPVAIREGAGWVWPRRDRLGSVIARTDAGGLSGSAITYDPYGTSVQASAASGGFLFTGRRYDAETGLYYIRARMYSPELGRFLQTDPVGYADQMNLYAYVGNDPGNATDPTGMCTGQGCYDNISFAREACFDCKTWEDIAAGVGSLPLLLVPGPEDVVIAGFVASKIGHAALKFADDIGGGLGRMLGKEVDRFADRRDPRSLQDEMTLEAASEGKGDVIIESLDDEMFSGMQKVELRTKSSEGKDSVVHYVRDPKTLDQLDYKFIKRSDE